MTEFNFVPPKILVEAKEWYERANLIDFMNPEIKEKLLALMNFYHMELEQRWNWLRENKDEIWSIDLETVDTGVAFEDKATFYFKNTSKVYEEYIGMGDRRDIKRFKNKCKRFGIPTDLIVDMTLK